MVIKQLLVNDPLQYWEEHFSKLTVPQNMFKRAISDL